MKRSIIVIGVLAAAVGEGVHLLRNDVGVLADRAGEHLGEFEDRRRHLAIAVESRHIARITVRDGKIADYRVRLGISFKYEAGD